MCRLLCSYSSSDAMQQVRWQKGGESGGIIILVLSPVCIIIYAFNDALLQVLLIADQQIYLHHDQHPTSPPA